MGELKTKQLHDQTLRDVLGPAAQYVAVHGISFGKPNPQVKVEPGDLIPEGVKPETIQDLLDHGDIQEVE